jgi:hypothetical protein
MYIGVAQELVDRISEKVSPMDTVTSINELIQLVRFNPVSLIEGLEKARNEFCEGQNICTECGSNEYKPQRYNVSTDADGGRPFFFTRKICTNCGKERF